MNITIIKHAVIINQVNIKVDIKITSHTDAMTHAGANTAWLSGVQSIPLHAKSSYLV